MRPAQIAKVYAKHKAKIMNKSDIFWSYKIPVKDSESFLKLMVFNAPYMCLENLF